MVDELMIKESTVWDVEVKVYENIDDNMAKTKRNTVLYLTMKVLYRR